MICTFVVTVYLSVNLWWSIVWSRNVHCPNYSSVFYKTFYTISLVPHAPSASNVAHSLTWTVRLWRWLIIEEFLDEINNWMKLLHCDLSLFIYSLVCFSLHVSSNQSLYFLVEFENFLLYIHTADSPECIYAIIHSMYINKNIYIWKTYFVKAMFWSLALSFPFPSLWLSPSLS